MTPISFRPSAIAFIPERSKSPLLQYCAFAIASIGTHGLRVDGTLDCDALQFEALLDAGRLNENGRIVCDRDKDFDFCLIAPRE